MIFSVPRAPHAHLHLRAGASVLLPKGRRGAVVKHLLLHYYEKSENYRSGFSDPADIVIQRIS